MLVWPHFLITGRRQETAGSETTAILFTMQRAACHLCLHPFVFFPNSRRNFSQSSLERFCNNSRFASQLRNPKFRKVFNLFRRQLTNLQNIYSADMYYLCILVRRWISPLPWRETIYLVSKAVCCTDVLEKTVWDKCSYQVHRNPVGNCPLTINIQYVFSSLLCQFYYACRTQSNIPILYK